MPNAVELLEAARCYHMKADLLEKYAFILRQKEACLIEQATQHAWHVQNERDTASEYVQELSQRADPDHDGYALHDR